MLSNKGRLVIISSDITDESVSSNIADLYNLACDSEKEPIDIIISSDGGDLDAGLTLHDFIQTLKCPVITFGIGRVCSAAMIVLTAGEKRLAHPRCYFLLHEPYQEGIENTRLTRKSLQEEAEDWKRVEDRWWSVFKEDPRVKWELIEPNLELASKRPYKDFNFGAEEALKFGLVDEIIKLPSKK